MTDKKLKEERRHGGIGLPVSCYRIQPPYANFEQLECHWHDEMELFKVERGTVQIQCGTLSFQAQAGEMAFFNSGELHAAQPLGGAEMDYSALVFSPEFLCGDQEDIARLKYVAPVAEGRLQVRRVVNGETETGRRMLEAFDKAMELLTDRPFAYELRVRGKLLEIFAGFAETGKASVISRERETARGIRPAIDYIRSNYQKQMTIEELASLSHMSSGHFCRLFKRCTFKTPVQYINSVRLSAAMDLLLESDRKVLDIAFDTGFNSLSYFIGVFKQGLGCTPTEFRRGCKAGQGGKAI